MTNWLIIKLQLQEWNSTAAHDWHVHVDIMSVSMRAPACTQKLSSLLWVLCVSQHNQPKQYNVRFTLQAYSAICTSCAANIGNSIRDLQKAPISTCSPPELLKT
jgi:hypothetical protein